MTYLKPCHIMKGKVLFVAITVLGIMFTSCHSGRKGITAVNKVAKSVVVPTRKVQSTVKVTSDMSDPTKKLLTEANGWLGTPYKYGGNSKSGVDCSGMVCMVFDNALSIKLPRNSAQQGEWCAKINKRDLQPGDLLFFSTRSGSSSISHVGMYIGDGNMIHASTSKGVIVSSLSEDYYVKTYHSCGRVAQYYAMVSGKKGKSENPSTTKPSTPSTEKPGGNGDILMGGTKKSSKEQVKDLAATVVKRTVDKATEKLVAATPGESSRAALEKQRRKILDEVVEQKIDSIVSDFFD